MTEPYALQPAWFIAATRDGHVEHCGDCPVVDMLTELLALRPALAVAEQELARLQALPSQLDRAVVRENGTLRGELAAAEAARDDFRDSIYEMLGELLEAHQITPDPCPGGPCVANALIAIGHRIQAVEAARDDARRDSEAWETEALESRTVMASYWKPRAEAAEQRATRLAALEAVARAYVTWLADMEAGRQGIMTGRRLLGTLTAAVAALDAVPAAEGEA